jgi:sn-glycerol 3-phosphate transport system permease protein
MWFGDRGLGELPTLLSGGVDEAGGVPVARMMWNSLIMALGITFGKIAISLLSAFAIVYFRFPFRMCFSG